MKLKMDREELQLLINILQQIEFIEFNDLFDSQVCRSVALQLLQKCVKKLADMKVKNSITLSPVEMLVMQKSFPMIDSTGNPYAANFIQLIINQIAPICLSI